MHRPTLEGRFILARSPPVFKDQQALTADNVQAAGTSNVPDAGDNKVFMAAILLAFFASQNRSLLAANCLIETIVEMYRRGAQLDTIQFHLSLVTLQSGSTLLSQQELDILTARCGIIMLTLHEVGCFLYSEASRQC